MAIPSLIIKRISGGDYLIDDLGIVVPNAGQTEITDLHDVRDALCSADLHAAAVAADLVLNDGSRDIPVAEISCFVRRFDTGHVDDVSTYTDLPGTGVERQIYLVADTKTTYMWNGSGWSQVNIAQKRCNGAIVSKFDDSLPAAYAHASGNGVTTYERFQDGADNASGAGYAGASREWVAGGGGDAGGGDYDGGVGGDLIARPGTGGAGSGTGSEGGRGRFVVYQSGIKAVSTDGIVLENETAATVGEKVQTTPRIRWSGQAWDDDDAVLRTIEWTLDALPISGNIVSSTLKFGHSLNGAAYTYPLQLTSSGYMTVAGTIDVTNRMNCDEIRARGDDTTIEVQTRSFTGTDSAIEAVSGTMTQGDGETLVGLMVRPTYTQSGTASGVDFVVSRKENSVGTGNQLLMDLGTCTTAGDYSTHTTKFSVSRTGAGIFAAGVTVQGDFVLGSGKAIYSNADNSTLIIQARSFTTAPDNAIEMATGTWTHSTGEGVAVCIKPTWNSSGTAAETCLLIDSTSTTVGSGSYWLIAAKDDTTTRFYISGAGEGYTAAGFTFGGNLTLSSGGTITTTSAGNITLAPNSTGIVIVDAAEINVKSGKKLSLGDGGAASDFSFYFNGINAYSNLHSGLYYNQYADVVKWSWNASEMFYADGYYIALGDGGYAADWYGKYTGTNCEMKIVNGEWQFFGGASEVYVINSSGQHGWFGAAPVAQHSSTGQTAGFTAGSGTPVNDDSTFTGGVGSTAYTIGDAIKALKNYGLMAA